jgi:ABC-type multidrug transport system ATPase subunit
MILDEPFKGLDEESMENAVELLKRMGPALSLLVTHNKEEAALFADTVLYVDGPPLKRAE